MSTRFLARQVVEHDPTQRLIYDTISARCLGGAGCNFYRCWVFPLYTPCGLTVIQEFPFDHPFHNGFFIGQSPVIVNGREANLWSAPPRRSFEDAMYTKLGRVDMTGEPSIESHDNGMRLTYSGVWRDENEEPLLDEVRTIDFQVTDDATICDMTSRKIASYGEVQYPQTKYGSIGLRVEPRLLPAAGGEILVDGNRRGNASILDEHGSEYVAYENTIGSQRCGVALITAEGETRGPWLIRDYGMALLSPTMNQSVFTPEGDSWSLSLRVVAYDGDMDDKRFQTLREMKGIT